MITDLSDRNRSETNLAALNESAVIKKENSYVHYAPALRLGNSIAVLNRSKDQTWTEIEPEARRLWEAENKRPWDEFKEIVRQAWEETRLRFLDQPEKANILNTCEAAFKHHYKAYYAGSGYTYNQCAKAYHYGYDLGVDERLRHRSWNEIKPEARHYWEAQSHGGPWEEMKEAAQYGWDEARNDQ